MSRAKANLLLLMTAAIWGLGFIAQSTAMDAIEPHLFTGLRFMAAGLALIPLAVFEHRRIARSKTTSKPAPSFLSLVLIGTILYWASVTQQIGLVTTTVTNSGFLTGIYVVLVPVISAVALRIFPHISVWPAAAMVMGGLLLLSGGRLQSLQPGDYWTITSALFWAGHLIVLGMIARATNRTFLIACVQFLVCGTWGIVIAPFFETVSLSSIFAAWPNILFGGLVSGGIAFTIQTFAQRFTTPSQAAIFLSSEALFAALFGALLLGDRLPIVGYVGCALILSAVLVVELWPQSPAETRSQST